MNDTPETDDTPKSWKVAGVQWLLHQGPSVVLLFLIVGMMGYGGHYAVNNAIPKHIEQIQRGYESHAAQLKQVSDSQQAAFKDGIGQIERSHERERETLYKLIERKTGLELDSASTGS
jgi:hypothetical protein